MKKALFGLAPALFLAGCGAGAMPQPTAPRSASDIPLNRSAAPVATKGLEAVIGKDAATLKSMFGEPRLDIREAVGRKLQFSGNACVLDAYLYPDGQGGQEVVTHVDARRSDGAEVDRAACVNALTRR